MKLEELSKVVNNEYVKILDFYDVINLTIEELSSNFVTSHLDCIVVLKNKKPYYIFTATDLIEALVDGLEATNLLGYMKIKEKQLVTAKINDSIFESYIKIRNKKLHHLIVVNEKEEYEKILTIDDFAQFLTEIAIKDSLTGLYNRRFFEFLIDKFENENLEFGIIFLDIDDFKKLNDTYGHDFGDMVLKKISKKIISSLRNIDYAFRVGDDEFIILVLASSEILDKIAKRLKDNTNMKLADVNISVSIGYAHFKRDSDNIKKVIEIADQKMYEQKRRKHDNS